MAESGGDASPQQLEGWWKSNFPEGERNVSGGLSFLISVPLPTVKSETESGKRRTRGMAQRVPIAPSCHIGWLSLDYH